MKKFIALLLSFLSVFIVILSIPSTPKAVHADTGPKPTMEIRITNLEQGDYIVGYGVKYSGYSGPHKVFIPGDENFGDSNFGDIDDLTLLYHQVTLPNEWYLSDISSFHENTSDLLIKSGYYWPNEFILIILNKTSHDYYLTKETKTYAFNSYFSFDMSTLKDSSIELQKSITLEKSYNYTKEVLEFFIRLVLTLSIEMLLALAFKFNKKSLLIIGITNVVTQIGLNLSLNLVAHFIGKSSYFLIPYILIELLIIAVEATIYMMLCERAKKDTKRFVILYAALANILSFVLGMILWLFV